MKRTQALSGAVAHAAELGAEGADELRQHASQAARSTLQSAETWITDNPWYSVAIAAGVGVLISMLLPKGSDSR